MPGEIGNNAFSNCANLKRVIFAEDSKFTEIGKQCFSHSGLEEFQAPKGLRKIGPEAFTYCRDLKRVVLNEGLETLVIKGGYSTTYTVRRDPPLYNYYYNEYNDDYDVVYNGGYDDDSDCYEECSEFVEYKGVFGNSGLEEITLPSTLKQIFGPLFNGCKFLKAVMVRDGCTADFKLMECLGDSVTILPPRETMAGQVPLWDLR